MTDALRIRMYDVGHGDCFLLTRTSRAGADHVLIDFGTTASPGPEEFERLMPIAEDIAREVGSRRLQAVVATHRHRDHIGGFARSTRGESPGNVIAALKPRVVVQPWTEDPVAESSGDAGDRNFVAALRQMQRVSTALYEAVTHKAKDFLPTIREQIALVALRNAPNQNAIVHLREMGDVHRYVRAGDSLAGVLPGFRVRVMGPVGKGKKGKWAPLTSNLDHECWRMREFWETEAKALVPRHVDPLFPKAPQWHPCLAPPQTRWLVDRIHELRSDQLLHLAGALDRELNNTSVILHIEGGGHSMLFSGDAEIDEWASVLAGSRRRNRLAAVDVYKVSHHGSGNGTPRALWSLLSKGGGSARKGRLLTLLSTRDRTYSTSARSSEVPRRDLCDRLTQDSVVVDTRSAREAGFAYWDTLLIGGRPPECRGGHFARPTLKAA